MVSNFSIVMFNLLAMILALSIPIWPNLQNTCAISSGADFFDNGIGFESSMKDIIWWFSIDTLSMSFKYDTSSSFHYKIRNGSDCCGSFWVRVIIAGGFALRAAGSRHLRAAGSRRVDLRAAGSRLHCDRGGDSFCKVL